VKALSLTSLAPLLKNYEPRFTALLLDKLSKLNAVAKLATAQFMAMAYEVQ